MRNTSAKNHATFVDISLAVVVIVAAIVPSTVMVPDDI